MDNSYKNLKQKTVNSDAYVKFIRFPCSMLQIFAVIPRVPFFLFIN